MRAPMNSIVPAWLAAPANGARGCVTGCLKKPFRIAVCVSMAHDLLLMAPLVAAARGRENSDKMPPGLPGGERICRSVKSSPGSNKRLLGGHIVLPKLSALLRAGRPGTGLGLHGL